MGIPQVIYWGCGPSFLQQLMPVLVICCMYVCLLISSNYLNCRKMIMRSFMYALLADRVILFKQSIRAALF